MGRRQHWRGGKNLYDSGPAQIQVWDLDSAQLENKQKKIIEGYKEELHSWADKFEEKHGRKPLESELIENLQDKMNPDILQKYVTEYLELIINKQGDDMV